MDAIAGVMANPYFPVDVSKLPCSREYVDLMEGTFDVAGMKILVLPLNHPQGCFGYRIADNGKVLAYCTDIEHGVEWSDTNVRRLSKDADLLVIDSQYTEEELLEHAGWGHSSWKQAINVGKEAAARKIALYHYDPSYEDTTIDAMLQNAQQHNVNVIASREGLELTI
jgi:ribonuclease BN (tRNA processing enzyme)